MENSKYPFYMLKLQGRFCSENRKIRVKLKKKKLLLINVSGTKSNV